MVIRAGRYGHQGVDRRTPACWLVVSVLKAFLMVEVVSVMPLVWIGHARYGGGGVKRSALIVGGVLVDCRGCERRGAVLGRGGDHG